MTNQNNTNIPTYDVIIVGAGLSGIGAAYHLQSKCPERSYTILEGRAAMGGTWDLFKYPGLRSDSDMYTLGFSFYPWKNPQAIADGASILEYIKETAREFNIDKNIQYNHKVINAAWSDDEQMWTLDIAEHEQVPHQRLKCQFLFMCSGYYNYTKAHTPSFPNSEAFEGQIIHPQYWDTSLDYADKKVIVIGSGATAITLVPEMAKIAEKVTMLQRSPTYLVNMPSEDPVVNLAKKILPTRTAYRFARWKNITMAMAFYNASKRWPNRIKRLLQKGIQREMGDQYEHRHFDPKYDPWDQRICLVPDSDLFDAMKTGKVNIVTNTIKEFTPRGILLNSGEELPADIIVTATGLRLQLLGGMKVQINGESKPTKEIVCYRGVMFSRIPNFAIAMGYTNASWTLKCDLNCHFVTRILNHMKDNDYKVCTPYFDPSEFEKEPLLDFDAGYIKRAADILPQQGSKEPWKVYQNYFKDRRSLVEGDLDDVYLVYK